MNRRRVLALFAAAPVALIVTRAAAGPARAPAAVVIRPLVGDGVADDGPALQALIDNADPGAPVVIPHGTYRCSTVHIKGPIRIYLCGSRFVAIDDGPVFRCHTGGPVYINGSSPFGGPGAVIGLSPWPTSTV